MSASPFDRLHPAVQYHVVNSLGWKSLRPAQLGAIDPILRRQDCLILAPTAGGKTEAAVIPVLSQALTEEWRGLSILYVCPIKALLNNLEERLSRYAALVGRSVSVWHGDVSASAKARTRKDPPDILLTTPESLEGMLISQRIDRRAWFGALRVAIVDELHAFAGDDRGWHLRAVLGRLDRFAPRPLQRIGLSATLGNPAQLLKWLAGHDGGTIVGDSSVLRDADVTVDYVGDLENAVTVISRLHRGSKRLVFCDSRSRVEEIASGLRKHEVRTFVSHSSLSTSERRQAERAFSEDADCVIVATSTLELGIDVGDLDYVFQVDSPTTVSSFMQRMGRTGRRPGSRRSYLFLTTTDESFFVACSIAHLWHQGYVEPVLPPLEPWHIVAQQAMALTLQDSDMTRDGLVSRLHDLFPEMPAESIRDLVDHMVLTGVLSEQDAIISFGARGEALYGRQNFVELVSSFASPLQFLVRYGGTELGYVGANSLRRDEDDDSPVLLLLGGRHWKITSVDWPKRVVWVQPTDVGGRAQWFGSSRALSFMLCQGIQQVLETEAPSSTLSKRGLARLDELRKAGPVFESNSTVIQKTSDGRSRWWTFAGGRANDFVAYGLRRDFKGVRANDFYLEVRGDLSLQQIRDRVAQIDVDELAQRLSEVSRRELKFSDCMPEPFLLAWAKARLVDAQGAAAVLAQPCVTVTADP